MYKTGQIQAKPDDKIVLKSYNNKIKYEELA